MQRQEVDRQNFRRTRRSLIHEAALVCCIAVVLLVGCSSSSEKKTESPRNDAQKAAPPNRILVYDFATLRADLPMDAPARLRMAPEAAALQDEYRGRQFGSNMAARLIGHFRQMGFTAERGFVGLDWRPNDVIIRGYLISHRVEQDTNWYVTGVDLGAAEAMAVVESFQITPQGLGRGLGSGVVTEKEKELAAVFEVPANARGHIVTAPFKISGANDGAKVQRWADEATEEIAARLKQKFQQQGWLAP